jgi:hypothetical protein
VENGGDFPSFDGIWRADLGLSEHSRARWEHQFLCDLQHTAAHKDRLNLKALKCMDDIGKRIRYLHRQQRREDLAQSKARLFHRSGRDEHGGLRTLSFDRWFSKKESEVAKVLKAEAAFTEAKDKAQAAAKKKGDGKGKDDH